MNKDILMAALMMVLVIVSAIQTFQLIGLKASVATGAAVKVTPTSGSPSGSGGVSVPSSLENLPGMVGGC